MLRLADRIFEFCASLKLAIVLILSLAFFLAIGTIYESHYGAQAASHMVYGSTAFLLMMTLLSINVLAAAMIRFPWSRKQTGFVITHLGIEILLGGCLWSYRSSVDGRITLRPGDAPTTSINLIDERINVAFPANGTTVAWANPVNFWKSAGFPDIPAFVAGLLRGLPQPRWPENRALTTHLAEGVDLEMTDWLPAAKFERTCVPARGHPPAVEIRLAGTTPMGQAVDEHAWLHPDEKNSAISQLFGGVIEASLWQASSNQEADEFLHPPDAKSLPPLGRLQLIVPGLPEAGTIDVAQALGKQSPAGGSGYQLRVDEYFPQAVLQNGRLVKSGNDPTDPDVHLHLTAPNGAVWEYNVSSKYPFLTEAFALGNHHQADELTPVILYHTPQALVSDRRQRGRLQLLQTTDGKLLARKIGLTGVEAFEVKIGQEQTNWVGMKLTIEQYVPAADLIDSYRPLHVSANKMDTSPRAVHLALNVDGQRQQIWLARGAGPTTLNTLRGPATLSYDFASHALPLSIALISAKKENDPGTMAAAGYRSMISVQGSDENKVETITMNHPISAAGYTFYQSDFSELVPGQVISTLSIRKDPGWILKYAGCALIVSGIFLMFYMKAYFQNPARVRLHATGVVASAATGGG